MSPGKVNPISVTFGFFTSSVNLCAITPTFEYDNNLLPGGFFTKVVHNCDNLADSMCSFNCIPSNVKPNIFEILYKLAGKILLSLSPLQDIPSTRKHTRRLYCSLSPLVSQVLGWHVPRWRLLTLNVGAFL